MKTSLQLALACGVLALPCTPASADPSPPLPPGGQAAQQLKDALFAEEARSDAETAMRLYKVIADEAEAQREIAATAAFRMGEIARKQGKLEDARRHYTRALTDFRLSGPAADLCRTQLQAVGGDAALAGAMIQGGNIIPQGNLTAPQAWTQLPTQLRNLSGPALVSPPAAVVVPDNKTAMDAPERLRSLKKHHEESPAIPFTATQLYEAAKAGDLESMRFLLDRGVDPNAPTTVEHAQPPVFAAVVYHQRAALDLLLERGGKLETRNARGTTVLHSPAWQGSEELVRYLLSKGADPKAMAAGLQETRGVRLPIGTPLHLIGFNGATATGKALIEAGADVNAACPESGHTPLHMAARFNNHEFARLLLAKGARVDARYSGTHLAGTTPMHEAAEFGSTLTGFVLAEYGASLNTPLTKERPVTPLHLAVRGNHLGFVREIISQPVVVNEFLQPAERPDFNAADELGDTALHIAARKGSETSVAFIRWMIAEGAPLDARNRSGLTPGELAASPQGRQDPDISAALRPLQPAVVMTDAERKGFEAVTRQLAQMDPAGRCSLLHAKCGDGLSAAVVLLLDAGVPVDGTMDKGRTPLMRAAAAGHVNVVGVLLDRGAAVNAADEGGRTALHYAAQERKLDTVRFLIEKGALVNACAQGATDDRGVWLATGTPLHVAARWGALDICRLLMEHGADVNYSPPSSAQTPLIAAARHGRTETVKALLAAGANLNATYSPKGDSNEAGSTALHNAAWFNCGETAKALLKAGADINHRKIPGTNLLTPFMLLVRENHFELAHQLCTGTEAQPTAAQPDLTLTDSEGDTALHVAVRSYSKASPEFISWLITRGAPLNAKNHAGLTPAELGADAKLGRPSPAILALLAHPPVTEKPE